MKNIYFTLLLFFGSNTFSQNVLPNDFKIGNYFEVFKKDSLKIYFNCTGTVVDKRCATLYRIGRMDTSIINVVGEFNDYYTNHHLYLKAKIHRNNLEGPAHYYYTNGTLKEEGIYNNVRDGKWIYYYPNGKIEKIFNYVNGEPLVLHAYSKNGKPLVVNGNGNLKLILVTIANVIFSKLPETY